MVYGEPFLPGYEQVHTIGGGGYEWAELRVYEKDGRFFYGSGSGCSCTYFEEQVTESDLIELQSLESAKHALQEFFNENSYYFTDTIGTYLTEVEKFRELGLR